jgi:ribosome biogenesis GTPase
MLDRFLVICESSDLEPLIVVNKIEVKGIEEARKIFATYEEIGYPVRYVSVKSGEGMAEIRELMCGGISVLTGPSGVGKSSLVNQIEPGLGLRVGAISETVGKGQDTTVTAELIRLGCGGYVADTPGLRELGLWGIDPDELDLCFPEFDDYRGGCKYGNSCTHTHEPGCAVVAAAASWKISPSRLDAYRRLYRGDDFEEGAR